MEKLKNMKRPCASVQPNTCHVSSHTQIHAHIQTCTQTNTHTHTYTHTHTQHNTHTHTHRWRASQWPQIWSCTPTTLLYPPDTVPNGQTLSSVLCPRTHAPDPVHQSWWDMPGQYKCGLCLCVCAYLCMCACVCVYVCVRVCVFVHVCAYLCTCVLKP